jgi:hypothetical protein
MNYVSSLWWIHETKKRLSFDSIPKIALALGLRSNRLGGDAAFRDT